MRKSQCALAKSSMSASVTTNSAFSETLGWGFEPQNTRLGGGCAIRATRPEHGGRQGLLGLRLSRPREPCRPVSGFCPRPGTPGEADRWDPRALQFFWRLFARGSRFAFFRPPGRLGLRRGRFLPGLRFRGSLGSGVGLGSPRFRRRGGGLGLRLLLLILLKEADRLQLRELAEVRYHAELGHEPFLVRLADVRELDFRRAVLQMDLELLA